MIFALVRFSGGRLLPNVIGKLCGLIERSGLLSPITARQLAVGGRCHKAALNYNHVIQH